MGIRDTTGGKNGGSTDQSLENPYSSSILSEMYTYN